MADSGKSIRPVQDLTCALSATGAIVGKFRSGSGWMVIPYAIHETSGIVGGGTINLVSGGT